MQLKDNTGTTAPGKYTDDGSGNCQANVALQDGADATLGTKADIVWSSGAGSVIALLKNIAAGVAAALTGQSSHGVNIGGVEGLAASGASVAGDPLLDGGRAQSAEPTAVAGGQAVAAALDLSGKDITSPYANRENMVRGSGAGTSTSAITMIAAQGASVKIYGTDLTITRNDAGTTAITVTLNDNASTVVDIPDNGGGGGFSHTFNVPLVWAANTAATCTPSAGVTTLHCSLSGFTGY